MCTEQQTREHVLCPHCDLVVQLPALPVNRKATCPRCHTTLSIHYQDPDKLAVGYAVSALLMLLLACLFSFVSVEMADVTNQISLLEIPRGMVDEGYLSLAVLFVIFVQFLPACCMLSIPLLCLNIYLPERLKIWMAKAIFLCKSWCMVEIFLAGVFVSFVKLMAYGDISVGISFVPYCLFCILQIRALQYIDRRWLWQHIIPITPPAILLQAGVAGLPQGVRSCSICTAILPTEQQQCSRCLTRGYARKKNSLQWTLALLLTSVILYIPANLMPIMITEALGSKLTSTILSGVGLLWEEGSYPVAMVIFIASIMVPSLKILAIVWLCLDVRKGQPHHCGQMLLIYELVEFVGRWSMIDVFVIAVLSALVHMGSLMGVYPAIGAVLFAIVVILTMFSAMAFDPRLIWDRVNQLSAKASRSLDEAR